jgi:non-canonical purine NTP pyrophosphatase (RdgB/HAM1 family)
MITFITWNQHKADYLAKHLWIDIAHRKVDLDELQSMDLHEIVTHKVKQAYDIVQWPVLVEDVSLEFAALWWLPGPFIRFFVDRVPFQSICDMIPSDHRVATARCVLGYYDGEHLELIEWNLDGQIALHPAGENGFWRDKIFIPDGYTITRAQMDNQWDQKTYATIKPFTKLRSFLQTLPLS